MKSILKHSLRAVVLFSLGGYATAEVACSSNLPIYGAPCPCMTGWTCCSGSCQEGEGDGINDICAASGKQSPAESSDPSGNNNVSPGDPLDKDVRALIHLDAPACLTADVDQIYFVDSRGTLGATAKLLNADIDIDSGARIRESQFNLAPQTVPLCGITRDGNDLYATMFGMGAVAKLSVSKIDGRATIGEKGFTFGALFTPSSIALDDSYVYIAERDSGAIKRFEKSALNYDAGAGGTAPAGGTQLGQGAAGARDLIADGRDLYWSDAAGIRRMSNQGGGISTLTSETGTSLRLADDALFWLRADALWTVAIAGPQAGVAAHRVHFIESSARDDLSNDPDTDEEFAARFFKITAFANHQGSIYFTSQRLLYAAKSSGGAAARLFVYRNLPSEEEQPTTATTKARETAATFLTVDSARFIWADSNSLRTRSR